MADTTITGMKVYPASLAVPTPGDQIKAATAPGAVRPGYQALLNGVTSAQAQLYGRISAQRLELENNTTLVVRHVGAFVVKDGSGVWTVVSDVDNASYGTYSPLVVDPTSYVTLHANKRYWVYARIPTGADPLDIFIEEYDGTAATFPDRNLFYRTTDQTSALLSTFYTDAAANILPYRQIGGRFMYGTRTSSGGGVQGNLILEAGHATVATAVNFGDSLANLRPAMVGLDFHVRRSGDAFTGVLFLDAGTTQIAQGGGDGTATGEDVWMYATTYGTGTQVYYMLSNASTIGQLWINEYQLW